MLAKLKMTNKNKHKLFYRQVIKYEKWNNEYHKN